MALERFLCYDLKLGGWDLPAKAAGDWARSAATRSPPGMGLETPRNCRGSEALAKCGCQRGKHTELEDSVRERSAHSFSFLSGSVIGTNPKLRYGHFSCRCTKDLKGGGVRDVSSCFTITCKFHVSENRRIYFRAHVFGARR